MEENASKAPMRAIEFHPAIDAALSLFSTASSLFGHKEFPVMTHREFIRNYLILRIIPISVMHGLKGLEGGPDWRGPLARPRRFIEGMASGSVKG
jgi:hypothetical protein